MPSPALSSLLLVILMPAAGPYAVFWSGGRTWLVDAGAARLASAPGYLRVGPDGALTRYRQRVEAWRPGPREGLPQPASRRTVWEQATTPARAWAPAFAPVEPWPRPGTARRDETALLQFTADRIATARFVRTTGADGVTVTAVSGAAYRPDTGAAEPAPPGAGAALAWAAAHVPFFLDPCLTRPAGYLPLEGRGGETHPYLVVGGAGPACADKVRALALAAFTEDAVPPGAVVDRRLAPDGRTALVLTGEAATAHTPAVDDLLGLADPCVVLPLRLERPGEAPAALGFVPALDGLRWLPIDSPWHRWTGLLFAPADRCGAPLAAVAPAPTPLDGAVDDWPAAALEPGAALCRLVESGRVWAGPADLSAGAALRRDGREALVAVRIRDAAPSAGDRIHLLLPGGEVRVTRGGAVETTGGGAVRAATAPSPDGYTAELRLPAAALGEPPTVAVAVDDADPGDPPGAGVRLWVAGEPVGETGVRPLPCERTP